MCARFWEIEDLRCNDIGSRYSSLQTENHTHDAANFSFEGIVDPDKLLENRKKTA